MTCFLPQDADKTVVAYVEEVDCALPPTPQLKALRKVSYEVEENFETVESNETNEGGQREQIIPVGGDLAGPVGIELSYKEYDPLLAGAFRKGWTDISLTLVSILSVTSTTVFTRSSGDFVADGIILGIWIKTGGFTNPANNGFHRVVGVTTTTVTVEGGLVVEFAPASATVKASFIYNDNIFKSFFFEVWYKTINRFKQHAGLFVNGLTLNFNLKAIIAGNFDFIGNEPTESGTTVDTNSVYTASETKDIVNSTSNLKTLRINRASFPNGNYARAFSFTINNNGAGRPALTKFFNVGTRFGQFAVDGTMATYTTDFNPFNAILANTPFSIDFKTQDAAGNTYIFDFLRLKYKTVPTNITGPNNDIETAVTWGAEKDPVTGKTMFLNRFDA